jgi:hypothetical protein
LISQSRGLGDVYKRQSQHVFNKGMKLVISMVTKQPVFSKIKHKSMLHQYKTEQNQET